MQALWTPARRSLAFTALLLFVAMPAAAQMAASQTALPGDVMLQQFTDMEETLRWPKQRAVLTEADWHTFSDVLAYHLAHGDEDVQGRAMQIIIVHTDRLDVRDAVIDVVDIFRNAEDRHLRRLAAVTLGYIRDDVGINMLDVLARHEVDPTVRKTARDVVEQYYASRRGPAGTL